MWAGGKGKICAEINARLGEDVGTYAEPFCGSMAVLLSREPARREVVCDTSSLLVNAWRAMAWDPLAMAYWADWPTFHDDLVARRRWLGKWVAENAERVQADADYCDPKAGAWWMWAMSHSIRGIADMGLSSRPSLQASPGAGYGVQTQRGVNDRPYMHGGEGGVGGRGLTAQRSDTRIPAMGTEGGPRGVAAQRGIPAFRHSPTGGPTAAGVGAARTAAGGDAGGLPAPVRWQPWFEALAARLKQVVVLNRGWQSACTPVALAARAGHEVAVLLDPPYVTSGRAKIYEQDTDPEQVNATARESYEWALKHGEAYRVAYCHTAGSFDFPPTWEVLTRKYGGANQDTRTQDAVAFSPRCRRPGQDVGQLDLLGR